MKKGTLLSCVAVLLGLCIVVLLLLTFRGDEREHETETEPEQTVITLVYAFQNSQWNACIEEVVRRFEDAHPDIDVQYEIHYEDTVYDDLLSRLAARD